MMTAEQHWCYHHAAAWNLPVSAMLKTPSRTAQPASVSRASLKNRIGLRAAWRRVGPKLEMGWRDERSR
jgi:hypothetical protein